MIEVYPIFNNIQNKLVLPPCCPSPQSHQLTSTEGDNLIEYCGRICYDSLGSSKSRSSIDYHQHINDVNHGCYDEETEVLTKEGWKFWRNVSMEDEFLTLDIKTNQLDYQKPTSILKKKYQGKIYHFLDKKNIDICVTPDHRMLSSPRRSNGWGDYEFVKASEFKKRSYKIRTSGGFWWKNSISEFEKALAQMIGFFIGDGAKNPDRNSYSFRFKKDRKINYLKEILEVLQWEFSEHNNKTENLFSCTIKIPKEYQELFNDCYTLDRKKTIPQYLLIEKDLVFLENILDGLINSDGTIDKNNHICFDTRSKILCGNIQELLLKLNLGFNTISSIKENKSIHYRLHLQKDTEHRIGWTLNQRDETIKEVDYDGFIYCASVPNTTLFVRRNNKCCWSGNSVQEHLNLVFEIYDYDNPYSFEDYMLVCSNRPGVFLSANPHNGNLRITANIRAIKEWFDIEYNPYHEWYDKISELIGLNLQSKASKLVPLALSSKTDEDFKEILGIVEPRFDFKHEPHFSFMIRCSRNCTHELVRHKFQTAVSQRSTRYVDESLTDWAWHPLIEEFGIHEEFDLLNHKEQAEELYKDYCSHIEGELIRRGSDKFTARKQARGAARGVLGSCLQTELVFTASFAQWMRILEMRGSEHADAEIRLVANKIYEYFVAEWPQYLPKIRTKPCPDGIGYALEFIR